MAYHVGGHGLQYMQTGAVPRSGLPASQDPDHQAKLFKTLSQTELHVQVRRRWCSGCGCLQHAC